ncbi:MAG: hypothetical protein CBD32_03265 [Actinobacteria bacterium TMED172]|nr:hypothetical protein [Cellvibrionales bacterium]OUW33483.1 MAG: hypothetical protein CBD32_03265 [Actinobacteria bacterium TMED172]|tara:strand:- start:4892 stop:5881 length:990 start_codon:yes stop_codon:yes gene_type:complete
MDISYDLLGINEAIKMSHAIRRVYGESYPIQEMYDAKYISKSLADGSLYIATARDSLGNIIGTSGALIERVDDLTADAIATMVDSNYRGRKIMTKLGEKLYEVYEKLGMVGTHLYALAFHDIVQRQSLAAGAVATGILPAWFDKQVNVTGYDYPNVRRGAVCLYLPIKDAPQREIYLPSVYSETISSIYKQLLLSRILNSSPIEPQLPHKSLFKSHEQNSNCQIRLIIEVIGEDINFLIDEYRRFVSEGKFEVLYLELPLKDIGIDLAINEARELGLFYGNLLIERSETDFLRMQYYSSEVASSSSMALYGEEILSLRGFIESDQKRIV